MVWKVVLRLQLAIFGVLRCCFCIVDMLSNLSLHQNVDPIFLGDSGVTYGAVPHPRTLRYPNLAMETLHASYVDQIPSPILNASINHQKSWAPKRIDPILILRFLKELTLRMEMVAKLSWLDFHGGMKDPGAKSVENVIRLGEGDGKYMEI